MLCDKLKPKFIDYNEHLAAIEKSVTEEFKAQTDTADLSVEKIAEIEKESLKRVKRDRVSMLDNGMKLIYEKATFTM